MSVSFVPLHVKDLFIACDSEKFMYGIDAVLLADFAKPALKNNSRIMDLCSGNAIIPILLSDCAKKMNRRVSFSALEIQQEVFNLAKMSVEKNGLENIELINGDLKNIRKGVERQTFNCVTCNPPYVKTGAGTENKLQPLKIARHEILCNLEDVVSAASYLLKSKGSFFMIHRPERLSEILILLKQYNLGVSRLRFVVPQKDKAPTMVLVESKKDSLPQLKVEASLEVYSAPGIYSACIKEIYKGL